MAKAKLDAESRSALRALKSAIDVVRKDDPAIAVYELMGYIECLLERDDHISRRKVEQALWPDADPMDKKNTIGRLMARLSQWEKHKKPGLGYIETVPDPIDTRLKHARPSDKGIATGCRMAQVLLAELQRGHNEA